MENGKGRACRVKVIPAQMSGEWGGRLQDAGASSIMGSVGNAFSLAHPIPIISLGGPKRGFHPSSRPEDENGKGSAAKVEGTKRCSIHLQVGN